MARSASGPRIKPLVLERSLNEAIDRSSDASRIAHRRCGAGPSPVQTPSDQSTAESWLTEAAPGRSLAPCSIHRRKSDFFIRR